MFAMERLLTKWVSCFAIQSKYLCAGSSQRRSSPNPFSPPMMWWYGTIPAASVSLNHICSSCCDLYTLRQRGTPVDQAAVTLVDIFPFWTALHTRPWSAHPQIGVSSPPRPWLSHWNHSHTFPSSTRFALDRTPPPRFAKKKFD